VTERDLVWVYVDVVCDLFHPGHVAFFRQARSLGDRLIVGVVGDEAVSTYKPRPIMTTAERVAVVEACRYVDRVIADAPLFCTRAHLDAIGAAFVVHGDDFPPEELAYWYRDVIGTGRLKTVPYTTTISSREIVRRVAQRLQAAGSPPSDAG
jgi:cytidyltransferase-like protein